MPVTLVLGAQWGDEGKGKLVDILAQTSQLCCRAAGGDNAGHTIIANGITYDFHILPSGLINPDCKVNLIGSGCVVNIPQFFKELDTLEAKGLQGVRERVYISDRAHVCFDLHRVVDGASEDILRVRDNGAVGERQTGMIGTTRKGIGPSYSDKVARRGVPLWMLVAEPIEGDGMGRWERRLRDLTANYRQLYGEEALAAYDLEDEVARMKQYRETLKTFVVRATPLVAQAAGTRSALASQSSGINTRAVNGTSQSTSPPRILIEGANALLLDIDHGTYPFVTSSNTGLGGVFTGLAGLSPLSLTSPGSAIIGVVKAYTTRVGSGPFPTELDSSITSLNLPTNIADAAYGTQLQTIGREFGVTTGRKRRCGWLDLVAVKYSSEVNCYTELNLTKLDVLDTFPEIRVATAYIDPRSKERFDEFPADLDLMEAMGVEYRTLSGWEEKTTGVREWARLPQRAREYVEFVEKEVGIPVKYIGTGPGREDMIVR